MVGANLHLEAVLSFGVGAHHHASVVQEDINPVFLGVDLGRALPHGGEAGQIALVDDEVGVGDLRNYIPQGGLSGFKIVIRSIVNNVLEMPFIFYYNISQTAYEILQFSM